MELAAEPSILLAIIWECITEKIQELVFDTIFLGYNTWVSSHRLLKSNWIHHVNLHQSWTWNWAIRVHFLVKYAENLMSGQIDN